MRLSLRIVKFIKLKSDQNTKKKKITEVFNQNENFEGRMCRQ